MNSQCDPKPTTRRGHPCACVRCRVDWQRHGNRLQHRPRDDFPHDPTPVRGRSLVSPADLHASSYRDPYLFHDPCRVPASRVCASCALPNPRLRRVSCGMIGAHEKIHGGNRRLCVSKSVLVHVHRHGAGCGFVDLNLQGRGVRKGGIDGPRTSGLCRGLCRGVCCREMDPILYRDHGPCPCPCLGRDLDDDERKTCVADRGGLRHLWKSFCGAFGTVSGCRDPWFYWKCSRVF